LWKRKFHSDCEIVDHTLHTVMHGLNRIKVLPWAPTWKRRLSTWPNFFSYVHYLFYVNLLVLVFILIKNWFIFSPSKERSMGVYFSMHTLWYTIWYTKSYITHTLHNLP